MAIDSERGLFLNCQYPAAAIAGGGWLHTAHRFQPFPLPHFQGFLYLMQTLFDAASHIAHDIERTRQHLANLEQALAALKPLITRDANAMALPYEAAKADPVIEDIAVVEAPVVIPVVVVSQAAVVAPKKAAKKSTKKVAKKAVSKKVSKVPVKGPIKTAPAVPSTGKAIWLSALGKKKLTVEEIVDAAMTNLDLPDAVRPVISNRATAWLYPSIKAGVIQQAGTKDGRLAYRRA